jgi:hypothetical protein
VTDSGLCVWDSRTGACVEQSGLGCSLISVPSRPHEISEKLDPYADVAHSFKAFKGKIFMLVCQLIPFEQYTDSGRAMMAFA